MRVLQDAIEEFLQDLPEHTLAAFIEKKLIAQDIKLSARQRELLTRKLMEGKTDALRLWTWKWWDNRKVTLEFTQIDVEQIEQNFAEFADKRLPEVLESTTYELARNILEDLKRRWPAHSRGQRRELGAFRKRLYDRWILKCFLTNGGHSVLKPTEAVVSFLGLFIFTRMMTKLRLHEEIPTVFFITFIVRQFTWHARNETTRYPNDFFKG